MSEIILLTFVIGFIALFHHLTDGINRLYHPKPGYDTSKIPDQTGKVIVITGGTTGIGRASAEQLCKKGAKLIIITSRSQASADKAAQEIKEKYGSDLNDTEVIGKALALEDHKDIEKFAEWFRSLGEPLHVLMLNAGLLKIENETTSLGMEKTMGVNWFGGFYLQHLLQDIIEQSAPSRIVILASRGAAVSYPLAKPIESYVSGNESRGVNQYYISKLFNIYHARELHRRLREKGVNNVYVNALHPGLVRTNVFDDMQGDEKSLLKYMKTFKKIIQNEVDGGIPMLMMAIITEFFGLAPPEGALTQLYAATSPDIEKYDISGDYLYPIARREDLSWYYLRTLDNLPPHARDDDAARKVWEYGESIIANLSKDQ